MTESTQGMTDFSMFNSIDSYMAYKPSQPRPGISFNLAGVMSGDVTSLSRVFVGNQKDGVMLDGVGQIANICQHATRYDIDPREALLTIQGEITRMGDGASEYQKRTLDNVNKALANLKAE